MVVEKLAAVPADRCLLGRDDAASSTAGADLVTQRNSVAQRLAVAGGAGEGAAGGWPGAQAGGEKASGIPVRRVGGKGEV